MIASITIPDTGAWSHWYLDDGYIAGPLTFLDSCLPTLEARGLAIGLQLNRAKNALLLSTEKEPALSVLPGVPRFSPSQCLRILGSPVGDKAKCQEWISNNVLAPLQ